MSLEKSEQQEATPETENPFYQQALAEFDSEERDSSVWEIVSVESAENLKPLNLKGEKYEKAYEEASKRLYLKLRADALLKGYKLLVLVNRIIWFSVFCVVILVGVAAFIGGIFQVGTNIP